MKNVVILIVFIFLVSCNGPKTIYMQPKVNPNQKDKYSEYCHTCLFVILDKNLAENNVNISESKNTKYSLFPNNIHLSDTVYYNKMVPKKMEKDCEEIIKVSNYNAVDIFVNKDSALVRNFAFASYRFVVVTKKNKHKRPTYIFTNDISKYPKIVEKLNKEIPEIRVYK
jgi:hypothetical protein